MAEKKHQLTALGIAYEAVIKLGYTHSKLARLDSSINYPTLRNIRDGKEMKKATERFYLKLFFDLINKEYERRMACGGDGAVSLLIVMKNILEAELKIKSGEKMRGHSFTNYSAASKVLLSLHQL